MYFDDYRKAADYVLSKNSGQQASVGIILGSGLGSLAEIIENPVVIPYGEIPGFPVSTAVGHKGNLIFGQIAEHNVLAMQGRFHYYEGYPMEAVTMPVRVMKLLGVETLLVSNAAGGVNFDFKVGDLMVIKDQINLLPNPLIGKNLEEFGTRFPDMSHVYDEELQEKIRIAAKENDIDLREGVYIQFTGPSFESPAEIRMASVLGADAVGMSTVVEAIAANHCGMRICGVSCVCNLAAGISPTPLTHDEVQQAANDAAPKFKKLLTASVKKFV